MPPKRKTAAVADDTDPAKMTVADLKAELTKRSLDSSGKKADLVQRLKSALASDSTDSAAPPLKKKKSVKKEEKEEKAPTASEAMASLKTDGAKTKKKRTPKKDPYCHLFGYDVRDDWDCMLNQTNIGHNNNKYYVIQMLQRASGGGPYFVFYRWGRVGEPGQNSRDGPFSSTEPAEKAFKKKFQDKTRNKWENRDSFAAVPGKYTLLEMDDDEDDDQAGRLAQMDEPDCPVAPKKVKPCTLPASTQNLVRLLFDQDMFSDAMKGLEIDTKKLPLGKLSKPQIAKGFEVLEGIEEKLNGEKGPSLMELSSKFYTLIPHDFGRQRPPVINSREVLQKKKDMLLVLADIELAQSMQEGKGKADVAEAEVVHPLDEKYQMLKARLTPLDEKAQERKVLETYLKETKGYRDLKILDIFEVDREGEGDRFAAHDAIANRRLLWHGTNVAVVAAILKTGLRIMPHSGGRVGRGIYFASENGKSSGYVRCANNIGIMFLVEVALGEEHHINQDNWQLTAPPKDKDCIIAKGRTEPDPTKDTKIKLEGKEVIVPQGKPIQQAKWSTSSFWQSEYLVYKESQARLRYLLKIRF